MLAPRACPRPTASPPRRSLEPPRARALLSLKAAPCALLRPPFALGCSSHSVMTALLTPYAQSLPRDRPSTAPFCAPAGQRLQTATRARLQEQSVSSSPSPTAISCEASRALHAQAPQYWPVPAEPLLPCSPVPAPLCCSPALRVHSGDDMAHDRTTATGRCPLPASCATLPFVRLLGRAGSLVS